MELIQTSKDLLYVIISFCILLVSVFFSWLLFYFAMIAKQLYDLIKGVRDRIKKVDDTIDAFREKIEHSTSYLLLIGEGIKKLVEVAINYQNKKKEGARGKKTKNL